MTIRLNASVDLDFSRIALFTSLNTDELDELVGRCERFNREPGETLFRAGDSSDGAYIIERGEVGVVSAQDGGPQTTLAYLGNGAVVGEMALVSGNRRSATVEAVAPTSGYWIGRASFQRLRDEGSAAAYKVLVELARILERRRTATRARVRTAQESGRSGVELPAPAPIELDESACGPLFSGNPGARRDFDAAVTALIAEINALNEILLSVDRS